MHIVFVCFITGKDVDCGEILTDETGSIEFTQTSAIETSDTSFNCLWIIVAPEEMIVEFEVLQMDFGDGTSCSSSYIRVTDVPTRKGKKISSF